MKTPNVRGLSPQFFHGIAKFSTGRLGSDKLRVGKRTDLVSIAGWQSATKSFIGFRLCCHLFDYHRVPLDRAGEADEYSGLADVYPASVTLNWHYWGLNEREAPVVKRQDRSSWFLNTN